MIEWYLKVVRDNYANFSGRARRKEYWYYTLCGGIIGLILKLLDTIIGFEYEILGTIYSVAVFIPGLAVAVRRFHDIGKSGWQFLLFSLVLTVSIVLLGILAITHTLSTGFSALTIIPSLLILGGAIWILILLCTEGDSGPNKYGEDPKRPDDFLDEIGAKETY